MAVPHESPEKEYCSTSEAAQRLGLSLGTVQQMVENGQLDGWKTAGGHRRIRVSSIEEFRARSIAGNGAQTQSRAPSNTLQVLVAEDDRILQKLYEHTFSSWGLPLQVRMVSSGIDGLLEIGRFPPDLLITDLRMPEESGIALIKRLREHTAPLGRMQSRHGSFLVTGNHEYYTDTPENWLAHWAQLGFTTLQNQHQVLSINGAPLVIAGVHDYHSGKRHAAHVCSPQLALRDAPDATTILLAHHPDTAYLTDDVRVDLQLSGHTHGGQVCVPGYGPLVTNCDLPRWRGSASSGHRRCCASWATSTPGMTGMPCWSWPRPV